MQQKRFLKAGLSLVLTVCLLLPAMPPVVAEAAAGDFGDGRDGALVIRAGETVTLPVLVPYQSVVEKNYTSVLIEAGGVLTTSAPNAGLVLRVQGDCTIKGTIDQSKKAPKPNLSNNYSYPLEIRCGTGGNGGAGSYNAGGGGSAMSALKFGGGYGGGGGGGGGQHTAQGEDSNYPGGNGGSSNTITNSTATASLFQGGTGGNVGTHGGGGGGGGAAAGGSGAGTPGSSSSYNGGGGGAGNTGGGLVLIYSGGHCAVGGSILCNGGSGGKGGDGRGRGTKDQGGAGGGGGGGGGGSIYICYSSTISNTANLNVSGGLGGTGGYALGYDSGTSGADGGIGTITILKAPDRILPVISGVSVSDAWGQTNTAAITASDDMGAIKDYAVTLTSAAPTGGWNPSNSFTLTANGTHYAWTRDNAGNVSKPFSFSVTWVDTAVPVISDAAVTPVGWANSSTKTITVTASDSQSGVADYAITTTATAPAGGWQTPNTFTKPEGAYYLWARDKAGRVSGSARAVVEQIDITPPTVSSVTVPTIWDKDNMVTISAADAGSGIKSYAVTRSNTAPVDGWQKENSFLLTANGTYYAWARDNVENVSPSRPFTVNRVDDVRPVITGVQLPESWAQANVAVIDAMDAETSVSIYAVSSTPDVPMDGWQTSRSITVAANGAYYAWCKDKVGNISAPFPFTVDRVDTEIPVVTGAEVKPAGWVGTTTKVITAVAADSQSGVADYAITTTAAAPAGGWQTPNTFTKPEGAYYLWARDKSGRVSEGYPVTVDGIDTEKPVVSSVDISPDWSDASEVKVWAADADSGLKDYAVSRYQYAPGAGWQPSPEFTLTANGVYYAFARDVVENVSEPARFEVTAVDAAKPVISRVNIAPGWSSCSEVSIEASDVGGGVKDYAVTADGTAPDKGWQRESKFTLTANGAYFAWCRDTSGNLSTPFAFEVGNVDSLRPAIKSLAIKEKRLLLQGKAKGLSLGGSDIGGGLPDKWVKVAELTVTAQDGLATTTDGCSGIADYNITLSVNAPPDGWQVSNSFTLDKNGTYYLWCRDNAGNVSAPEAYHLNKIDDVPPEFEGGDSDGGEEGGGGSVSVPKKWAPVAGVTVRGSDNTGMQDFAVTLTPVPPDAEAWQDAPLFDLDANGTYFAWIRDKAGNVVGPGQFEVTTVDNLPPTVSTVTAAEGEALIDGGDAPETAASGCSGVVGYAISKAAPEAAPQARDALSDYDWKPESSIRPSESGTFEARTIDRAGNISEPFRFDYTAPEPEPGSSEEDERTYPKLPPAEVPPPVIEMGGAGIQRPAAPQAPGTSPRQDEVRPAPSEKDTALLQELLRLVKDLTPPAAVSVAAPAPNLSAVLVMAALMLLMLMCAVYFMAVTVPFLIAWAQRRANARYTLSFQPNEPKRIFYQLPYRRRK